MAYLTKADLLEKLGQDELLHLTDKTDSGDINDEAVENRIEQAITFATGKINGYARTRYAIPLASNEEVRALAMPLALYDLYTDSLQLPEGKYEIIKDGYNSAIKFLEALSSGKASLDSPLLEGGASGSSADVPFVVVEDEEDVCRYRCGWVPL